MPDEGLQILESTLTTKGQTTLPKAVREALGLRPGDRLRYFVLEDGTVRLSRPRALADLAGCLAEGHRGPAASLDEMDEAVAAGAADRYRRAVER